MKKQRSRLILMGIAAIVVAGTVPATLTAASDNDWQYDETRILSVDQLDVGNNFLNGTLNMARRENLGVGDLCFFTYNEEIATSSQVEAEIANFQQNPAWMKNLSCNQFFVSEYQAMVLATDFSRDQTLSQNHSGILYYAMNVKWWERNEWQWLWGKVDYHRCAYNPEDGAHLDGICDLVPELEPAEWRRSPDGNLSPYIAWAEERYEVLTTRLNGVEARINAWNGDKDEKVSIMTALQNTENLTSDAINPDELNTRVQSLRSLLEQKANQLAQPNPPEETQPDSPENSDDDKKDDQNNDQNGDNRDDESKEDNLEGDKNPSPDNNQPAKPGLTEENKPPMSQKPVVSQTEAKQPAAPSVKPNNATQSGLRNESAGNLAQNTDTTQDKTPENSVHDDNPLPQDLTGIELPSLREDEKLATQLNLWSFWWVAVVALALGGVAWWCK